MSAHVEKARRVVARVKEAVSGSPWGSLAGKGAAWLVGMALLAAVGSGRMARWISPAPTIGIAVAEAATAPLPGPSTPPSATVSVEVPASEMAAAPADAGAPPATEADGGTSNGVAPDGKVILNLASEQDLRRLPGIGRGRAQAILALRGKLKKFTRVEDLLKVKGIGRRGLARLRPLVRVD